MGCMGLGWVTVNHRDGSGSVCGQHSEPCKGCSDCAVVVISERARAESDTGMIRDDAADTKAVMEFSLEMLRKLRKNAHKPHWVGLSNQYLFLRLVEEMGELAQAMSDGSDAEAIVSECCDVANFALMIASNARRLKP